MPFLGGRRFTVRRIEISDLGFWTSMCQGSGQGSLGLGLTFAVKFGGRSESRP